MELQLRNMQMTNVVNLPPMDVAQMDSMSRKLLKTIVTDHVLHQLTDVAQMEEPQEKLKMMIVEFQLVD